MLVSTSIQYSLILFFPFYFKTTILAMTIQWLWGRLNKTVKDLCSAQMNGLHDDCCVGARESKLYM